MTFKDANSIEQIVWSLRWAELPRSRNRALIDSLSNGSPPYDPEEEKASGIQINSNDLGLTRLAHDARQQFYGAMTKPGFFFTARTDFGAKHRRQEWGSIVTREINRIMKRSLPYFELKKSKIALDVLHGIGPGVWETKDFWCADPRGIEDVLVPSGTRLSMKGLPFIALYCQWTPRELQKLTSGPNVDPAWNMDVVNAAIKWSDEQTAKLSVGTNWHNQWMPEKWQERLKENSGLYASDLVQTIDAWDFYYWNDDNGEAGWSRKIILDAEGGYRGWSLPDRKSVPNKNLIGKDDQFLYDAGNRVYASDLSEIIHFQFADLSAVAPFRYHSVRSLGFLLYEVCHLQNRMRCKFSEAVFETLMPYFRVDTSDDAERALKLNMISRGFVDSTVHFLTAAERWQVNHALAEAGMQMNQQLIDQNSSAFVQNQNYGQDRTEKTKFQVMAEVNAMTTLINAALQQAYFYETREYEEDFRRFCLPDSRDPEVKQFRARCLKQGVPEKLLVAEAWELEPERVMGAGNKSMEMAIAQQLMEWRQFFPPEAQDRILRKATLAIIDDAAEVNMLLPEVAPKVSDSQQAAMSAIGTLMSGGEFEFATGLNRTEITEILLVEMKMILDRIAQMGEMATVQEVLGVQKIGQVATQLIQQLAQDPTQKENVRRYTEALGQMENELKAISQQMAEKQQAGGGDGQIDPKDQAKVQGMMLQAQTKAQIADRASQQRTRQREEQWAAKTAQQQVSHDERLKQDAQKHALDLQKKILELQAQLKAEELKLGHSIKLNELTATAEPATEPIETQE